MGDSVANGVGTLEVSVSFGRFEKDSSLCWEKWSAFPTNKYLEEVEKCSTPGSVAQKAAYFEAHYKKIAARKIEQLQDQDKTNTSDEESDDPADSEEQQHPVGERLVDVKEEELLVGELDFVENAKNPIECDGESDLANEVDGSQMVEPMDIVGDTAHEDEVEGSASASAPASASASAQPVEDAAEPEVESYCRDDNIIELHESDVAVKVEQELIKLTSEMVDSRIADEPNSDLITAKQIEDSPPQVEESKVESSDITSSKDLPESEEVTSSDPAKEEAREIESQESVRSPMSVIDKAREDVPKDASAKKTAKLGKSTRSQKISPVIAGTTTTSSASAKKTPVSSRPRSPLISCTSKLPKPALSRSAMSGSKTPAFSRSSMSESKASSALSKSTMSESKAIPKKENGLSLPSKKSTTTRVESRRTIVPTSLHTSLNFDPANSSSLQGGTVRKSLIMERMGDKDIVKRAFKAFQKNFNQLSSSTSVVDKPVSTSQSFEKDNKKPKGPVVGIPPKKTEGLIKSVKKPSPRVGQPGLRKASVSPGSPSTLHSDQKSVRPVSFSSPYNLRSYDKPNKQKEVSLKLENRSISKSVEKPRFLHQAKVVEKKETESKKLPAERNHIIRTKPLSSSVASKSSFQKRDNKA